MATGFVQVPPDSTGKRVDCVSLSAGGATVVRQTVVIADPTKSAGYAIVSGGQQLVKGAFTLGSGTNQIGYLQKISASVTVQGNVGLNAGAAHIGEVNISLMPAVVLASGAAHVGEVNISTMPAVNISAMPAVNISAMPAVVLAAGANNIGSINNISATVNVAGTFTISTIDKISATVTVAGIVSLAAGAANIGTVNNISAAVVLAAGAAHIGEVNISTMPAVVLAAGTNNIGTIQAISAAVTVNVNAGARINGFLSHSAALNIASIFPVEVGFRALISATAAVAHKMATLVWGDKQGRLVVSLNHPSNVPSANQGPVTVAISSSATVALIAAPGAGRSVYIDSLLVTNGSATLTELDMFEASATATAPVRQFLAANGGGFTQQFNPPWQVSANTALNMRLTVNASDVLVTAQFHVGPS